MTDEEREARIEAAFRDLAAATTIEGRLDAWHRMQREILARSPRVVAEMERERGLT